MDRQDIEKRIEKKQKDIEKINKRIAKWSKGLRPQDIEVAAAFGNAPYGTPAYKTAREKFVNYRNTAKDIPESDDWNKGPNISELANAYVDLCSNQETLNKYNTQLQKLNNFDNSEKIKPIWDFLEQWKQKTYDWYYENAQLYFNLKKSYSEDEYVAVQRWMNENPESDEETPYKHYNRLQKFKNDFYKQYFSEITDLTKSLVSFKRVNNSDDIWSNDYSYESFTFDSDKLNKILDQEKQRKYTDLVNKVTEIVGNIQDASNLSIGRQNGELNGIVVGDKGKAMVRTISAGGYNNNVIVNVKHGQIFHYRVIVTPIR